MIIIGERINASNKSVGEAILGKDTNYITELALAQQKAGADYIDLNTGTGKYELDEEKAAMKWLVATVRSVVDLPFAIDSEHPEVIKAALDECQSENIMINSVTAESKKLAAIAPLVTGRDSLLVALAMGSEGVPDSVEKRLEACESIVNYMTQVGLRTDQILFDPLVIPVSVDSKQGLVTLKTIEEIKSRYPGARTVVGLSNISYGLPNRKLINRSFLLMAAYVGLDAAILDPLDTKIMSMAKVANMLTDNDNMCRAYIRAHRKGIIVS